MFRRTLGCLVNSRRRRHLVAVVIGLVFLYFLMVRCSHTEDDQMPVILVEDDELTPHLNATYSKIEKIIKKSEAGISTTSTEWSTLVEANVMERFNQSFLDYDLVFSNTSKFQFPLMVFGTVGRLGNCLSSYATALTFNGRFNATIAVTHGVFAKVAEALSPQHLPLPVVADDLIADAHDMGVLENVSPDYIKNDMTSHLQPTIEKAVKRYEKTGDEIMYMMEGYPNRMEMLTGYHDKIIQSFQIHSDIKKKAAAFLQKTHESKGKSVTFIGIHVRWGDYPKFMKNFYECDMPKSTFFKKALSYYRSRFLHPVFVVCSDDMIYAKRQFAREKNVIYSDFSNAADDLALLAECSHSIMTVGSFGFWGSYLAGGQVLYPFIKNCTRTPFVHPSKLGEKGYRNWISIDT